MFTGSHDAAMPPKRKRAVEHVSAALLRRKLREGGKSEVEIKAIRGISALRSVCLGAGIPIVQDKSGAAIPLHLIGDLGCDEFAREYEALSREHIEQGTRQSYNNSQNKMIDWWSRQPEYAHLVENGKVKDLGNFPVQAFFNFLMNQVDADLSVTNNKRMLIGKSGLSNYRKAFSNLYAESNPAVFQTPAMLREISQKMKSLRKRHTKDARSSLRKAKEGKEEVPFGLLLGFAKIFLEEGMFWEHAYCMLCWELMARSDNVGDLTVDHMQFINDSLHVLFSGDKMHTTGDGQSCKEPKHCYANSTDVTKCLFVALGLYLLTSPQVGCKSKELFPGTQKTQKARFRTRLNDALQHPRIKTLLERYGLAPEDIGSHSFRKGAGTYCSSGCTGGPSIIAVLLRGGWEIGAVLDRYLRYSEAGDEFVGRVLSGLPLNDASFTSPPPHFKKLSDLKQGELQRHVKLLFPLCEKNPRLYPVAEKLFASVLRALPALLDGESAVLPVGSAGRSTLLATALLRNRSIMDTWSPELIVEDMDFKVSGVPTWHTMLAAVLESLRLSRNLPSIIKTDILAELDKRDAASGTVSVFVLRQELEQSEMRMRKVVEATFAGLNKNSHAEVVVRDAAKGGRYWWCAPGDKGQPSIHRLPDNFVLDKCTVRTAWGLYWQGKEDPTDSCKRFPPYRILKRHDFFSEASYKRFSGWRACFEHDCVHLLEDSEEFKRACSAMQRGDQVELADESAMWECVADHFSTILIGHRRPAEASISTLVTRRYEAYALLAK